MTKPNTPPTVESRNIAEQQLSQQQPPPRFDGDNHDESSMTNSNPPPAPTMNSRNIAKQQRSQQPPPRFDGDNGDEPSLKSSGSSARYYLAGAACAAGALAYYTFRYHVASANEVLVKTGFLVPTVSVAHKCWQIRPIHKIMRVSLEPRNYRFDLHAWSKQKVPFKIPASFTIGPYKPDGAQGDLFENYAIRMAASSQEDKKEVVQGIIHGQTRIAAANLTVEEMFSDKEAFKDAISSVIKKEMEPFGLNVFNCNFEEMVDVEGHKYFDFLSKKAVKTVENTARIDVAAANRSGDIGESERAADARQRIARIDADAKVAENDQQARKLQSEMELETAAQQYRQAQELAKTEADAAVLEREAVLNKLIEDKKQEHEYSMLRASHFMRTQVDAERKVAEAKGVRDKTIELANGEGRAQEIAAEAEAKSSLILAEAEAKAKVIAAEAEANARKKSGDAEGYFLAKEAEGKRRVLEAEAEGVRLLYEGLGRNPKLAQFYFANANGVYEKVAGEYAKALNGLQPKINVWETGTRQNGASNSKGSSPLGGGKSPGSGGIDVSDVLLNVVKGFAPMVDAVGSQTNLNMIPDFMRKIAAEGASAAHSKASAAEAPTADQSSASSSSASQSPLAHEYDDDDDDKFDTEVVASKTDGRKQ